MSVGPAEDVRDWSDEKLIREILDTDNRDLFAVLVRRHQDKVYTMCVRFIGRPTLAGEVAQDVFVAVYRNLDRFRGDARFSTWLYRVVINHCKNKQAYRARRHAMAHDSIDQTKETEDGEVKRELPSPSPGPEETAQAHQRRDLLERGLAQLKPEHREIIVLVDLQDMPYDEVAATLGVAEGTVKSRLHRARSALKDQVGKLLATTVEARGS